MTKITAFGEIMMRLSPPGYLRYSQANSFDVFYGGAESNTAISLVNYGIPVNFITRLPKNDFGDCVIMELRKHGLGTGDIIFGGDRLGIYFLEKGAVNRGSKVVYDRANSAMTQIAPGMIDWKHTFKDSNWFHWTGITPAISKSAADTCLEALKIAKSMGLTISMDYNYRAKLWNYGKEPQEVMTELTAYCDVILVSVYDAAQHFDIHPEGKTNSEAEAFVSVSNQLMQKFPQVKTIVCTSRNSISASHNTISGLLYDGEKLYTSTTYEITHIVDRVGGGDAFMGGIIYGLINHPNDHQKTVNFATAASCLKHTIEGDANLTTVEEVEKLTSGDTSGRVAR